MHIRAQDASGSVKKVKEIPQKLLEQLAPGGRLIMPMGPSGRQDLIMVTRKNGQYEQVSLGAVSFVPLVKGK